jgi:hypothetical protein
MLSSSPHAFRYEPALCSLAEGETLGQPRSDDGEPRKRRTGLRARLALRRAAARRRSAS